MSLVATFTDDGISGAEALADRPDGRAMLVAAAAGKLDAIVVHKLDRLGRTARVILDAADQLSDAGVALISATEPLDTRPQADPCMQAVSRFVFQLLASLASNAELDRAIILGRTMEGRGSPPARPPGMSRATATHAMSLPPACTGARKPPSRKSSRTRRAGRRAGSGACCTTASIAG
jgi:hypothetical protein